MKKLLLLLLGGIAYAQPNMGNPNDLSACDTNSDGYTVFDLTLNDVIILNGLNSNDYTVSYHQTSEDADIGTNAISQPMYYTNLATPLQNIYARLTENGDSSNYAVAYFTINAVPAPLINTPEDLIAYSNTVDLTVNNAQILGDLNSEEYNITFYTTEASASVGAPQISTPETYNTLNGETVWIRVESIETGCFSVASMVIYITSPAPTGVNEQYFNEGETLSVLEAEGENIQWYESTESDTPLPLTTPLVDNTTYYATQTVDGMESMERFAVTAHITLGLEEQLFQSLTYYPNPVSNILTLSNTNTISNVEVYNLLGQKVFANNFSNTEIQVDLSNLETGIYMVKISSQETQKTIRIQKQ
ncbi:T9SS type A sorting domain-containing protein [Flavobacterium rakeshii]|uniref:T9SS type A sorting domain-containing protein n=1 Tax=Flavobacterium rakeshii TaxID=1038845 RepID=A0A6N8HGM2_9FLAO|nr:T9SS type A sorting domain-containing protein [Flavobacterium rakeshii]MUV04841.1 T9SS type A sorting domain-containing protein [Flavobacterium rakeshii]